MTVARQIALEQKLINSLQSQRVLKLQELHRIDKMIQARTARALKLATKNQEAKP